MLTQKILKTLLDYDLLTGVFRWKVNRGNIKAGDIAGYHDHKYSGYDKIQVNSKMYLSHRLAFLYVEGYFPENQVDHINRVRNDNRWCNLREVSQRCNNRNCSVDKRSTSGVTGVTWDKSREMWEAFITISSKHIFLKRSSYLAECVIARWNAEVKYNWNKCSSCSSAYQYLKRNSLL